MAVKPNVSSWRIWQLGYFLVVVLGALSIGLLAWRIADDRKEIRGTQVAIRQQQAALRSQQKSLREQQQSQARLSQKLCTRFNDSRIASNDQLRVPLRATEYVLASILRTAATNAKTAITRSAYTALARRFEALAERVALTRNVPCDFTR
jgi:septal ring factor EnvC (AmiA/AmiB activator)